MATITIRLDDNTKNSFANTCDNLGLDMTSAMMIYIKKVAREKKIPFEVSYDPFYCASNIEHLERGVKALNNAEGKEHELIEVD